MTGTVQSVQRQASQRNPHRLIGQFYLSILSITAIDLCLALIYEIPLDRFLAAASLLVLLSLGGGFVIFSPIRHYLLGPDRAAFPVRRIATLGSLCTAYMGAVLSTLAAVKFLLLPVLLGFDIGSILSANERLWLPVLHTLYYTGLIYFVMLDYEAVLRVAILRDYAMRVPAAPGRLLYRMVQGLRERTLIRETFGRYIPQNVASAILASDGDLKPRSAIATVLYADIEEFTSIAEKMSPDRVVEMLNEYFSSTVELIEQNNGVITQFQGDAMLVTFNLPVTDERHAESAIRAALDIQRVCAEREFAGSNLRIRIGIATGTVTAGNVGSDSRFSYTVHGDAVNLAARLEQLNKRYGSYLLMDEATISLLTLPMPITFVDEVKIRGKEQFVRIYRHDFTVDKTSRIIS